MPVPSSSAPSPGRLFVGSVAGVLLLQLAGMPLTSPSITLIGCGAMLLLGLPHGTLDLQLIARARATRATAAPVLLMYVALAAAALMLWRADPVLALAAFILIAVAHFAEDWSALRSEFLSHGMALAILVSPSLLWRAEMRALFVIVAGEQSAGVIADVLFAVAPVSLLVSGVALCSAWSEERRETAVAGLAAIAAMILLPPVVGFALFFCLFHSPRHFRHALETLSWKRFDQWRRVVLPLTAVAFCGAIALAMIEVRADLLASAVAASFMTLSVLTIPHMLVPLLVPLLEPDRMARRAILSKAWARLP